MQTSSQEDIEPEESIYSKFATDKDKFLFQNFMQQIGKKNSQCREI